jgi:hypothetical protein
MRREKEKRIKGGGGYGIAALKRQRLYIGVSLIMTAATTISSSSSHRVLLFFPFSIWSEVSFLLLSTPKQQSNGCNEFFLFINPFLSRSASS